MQSQPCQNILDSHLATPWVSSCYIGALWVSGMVFGDAMIHRSRFRRSRRVFWNFELHLMVQLQHCHWNAWDMENFVTWKTLCYGNRKAPPFQCHPPAKIGTSLLSTWLGSHIMSWRMVVLGGIRWSSILIPWFQDQYARPSPSKKTTFRGKYVKQCRRHSVPQHFRVKPLLSNWCTTLGTQAMLRRYL